MGWIWKKGEGLRAGFQGANEGKERRRMGKGVGERCWDLDVDLDKVTHKHKQEEGREGEGERVGRMRGD